jgi:Fe-S-cluster containining protein
VPLSYKRILARADEHFAEAFAKNSGRMQCAAGCTMCCHGLFEIGAADVAVIADGLNAINEQRRAEIVSAAAAISERFEHPDLRDCSPEEKEAFFERSDSVACPALDSAGRCSIYDSRPLVCRTFGLPIRDGDNFLGQECDLNFTDADLATREAAAWDLQWEDILGPEDEYTVPEAILLADRLGRR